MTTLRFRLGYWRFSFRLWLGDLRERLIWRAAYLVPRSIALIVFVRVCGATSLAPDEITYVNAYKTWAAGAGK